jgi:glycosyltransferase involved in cell wall biosynthesis
MSKPTRVAILIPALDEAATIAQVVAVARRANLGPVLVIDDGSADDTAALARRAGAEVLRLPRNRGKGGALAAGARERSEEVLVLLDGDLVGLRPQHVRALAEPVVRNEADMTRGVFVGGRWATTFAQKWMPVLNGQRALRRAGLLAVEDLDASRYGVEVAISEHARHAHWRTRDVPLRGVSQVMKEEKRGPLRGLSVRVRMYAEILLALLRSLLPGDERSERDDPSAREAQRNTPRR